MKRCITGLCLILALCAVAAATAVQQKWPTFKGAWFGIQYPAKFMVRPSLRGATSGKGYDSAFFRAPDGSVEFYVYSPQWTGNPTDIAINTKTEKYVDRKVSMQTEKRTTLATIKAKNGSYTRSFVDVDDMGMNTRLVFGIKYRSQKAYDKYRTDYLRFKKSLAQYAD